MFGFTHATIGATAGAIIGWHTGSPLFVFAALGALFGILPDMDIILHETGVARHRSVLSHSLLSSLLLSLAVFGAWYMYPQHVPRWTWLVAFSATWLHTAADSLTYSGTHLFYPFSKKRVSGPVRSSNIVVNLALMALSLVILYLAVPGLFSLRPGAF